MKSVPIILVNLNKVTSRIYEVENDIRISKRSVRSLTRILIVANTCFLMQSLVIAYSIKFNDLKLFSIGVLILLICSMMYSYYVRNSIKNTLIDLNNVLEELKETKENLRQELMISTYRGE